MFANDHEPSIFATRVIHIPPPPDVELKQEPEYSDEDEPEQKKGAVEEIIRFPERGKYLPGEKLLRKIAKRKKKDKKPRADNLPDLSQIDRVSAMFAEEIAMLI